MPNPLSCAWRTWESLKQISHQNLYLASSFCNWRKKQTKRLLVCQTMIYNSSTSEKLVALFTYDNQTTVSQTTQHRDNFLYYSSLTQYKTYILHFYCNPFLMRDHFSMRTTCLMPLILHQKISQNKTHLYNSKLTTYRPLATLRN